MRRRLPGARYMRAGKGGVADERSSRTNLRRYSTAAALSIHLLFYSVAGPGSRWLAQSARIAAASMIGPFEDREAIVDFRQSSKKANANLLRFSREPKLRSLSSG